VEEFRYAIGEDSVGTICGAIDNQDNALETAKRELKEEIGVEAKEWIALGRMDPFTMGIFGPTWLYLARGLSFGVANPEGTETIKVRKMPFSEAVQMVMDSKITLSLSAVNILKAVMYLGKL
jgi:8-oxo-dGTP pyrophosphatase MutT (NUDIX family)